MSESIREGWTDTTTSSSTAAPNLAAILHLHLSITTTSREMAASSSSSPTPIYLEFRNLSVALKSRVIKKPAPIHTIEQENEARVVQKEKGKHNDEEKMNEMVQLQQQPQAAGSTVSLAPSSASSSAPQTSLPPLLASSSSPLSLDASTPPFIVGLDDVPLSDKILPTPPEFSFLRGAVAGQEGRKREDSTHSEPVLSSSPTSEKGATEEKEEPLSQPVMIFRSQPTLSLQAPTLLSKSAAPSSTSTKCLILDNLSGFALPGQLTVIMGSSGAGKTTLLNILSGRHSSSTSRMSSGSILLNGRTFSYGSLSKQSGFVQQSDCLLPTLTVREIICFAAFMKLPTTLSNEMKEQRVDQVIQELALVKCQHFLVGSSGAGDADSGGGGACGGGGGSAPSTAANSDPNAPATISRVPTGASSSTSGSGIARSGISGGEQRRTSIGVELVTDPQLLFLDEPTSGLDSSTAYTIVSVLKHLAVTRGRTIVLTIHSPSSKIFSLFDRLILLTPSTNGARVAYQGPANGVMAYFDRLDLGIEKLARQMGRESGRMTVSDYLMILLQRKSRKEVRNELMEAEGGGKMQQIKSPPSSKPASATIAAEEETPQLRAAIDAQLESDSSRVELILSHYATEPDSMPQDQMLDNHAADGAVQADGVPVASFALHPGSSSSLSWLRQFFHLSYRSYLTHRRNLSHLRARLLTNIFLGLFAGLLYLQTDHTPESKNYNQTSIFNRIGFIFFSLSMQALITLVNSVLTFTEERSLFLREKSSKMYSTSAYFLSKFVVELPLNTILTCVFGTIGYAMAGMQLDGSHFLKFLLLLSLLGHSIASVGLLLSCLVPLPIIGIMLCPLTVIPFMLTSGFFININSIPVYLSWLQALSPHRYTFSGMMSTEFVDLKLHCDADQISAVLLNPTSPTPESFSYCSIILGRQVLDLLSLPYDEYWQDIYSLVLIAIGFRLAAFAVLTLTVRESQLQVKEWMRRGKKWVLLIWHAIDMKWRAYRHPKQAEQDKDGKEKSQERSL